MVDGLWAGWLCYLAVHAASSATMKVYVCWLSVYAGLIADYIDGLAVLAGWLCWLACYAGW
jgi:hypothetical protein